MVNPLIITSTERKQSWKKLFGRHLSNQGLPDNLYFLYLFVNSCMGDKELRDAMLNELEGLEKVGIKKEEIVKSLSEFAKEQWLSAYLSREIRKIDEKYKGDERGTSKMQDALINLIDRINTNIPYINYNIYIALVAIIKNYDLLRVEAPREEIIGALPRPSEERKIHGLDSHFEAV